jgi:hypothetical protein
MPASSLDVIWAADDVSQHDKTHGLHSLTEGMRSCPGTLASCNMCPTGRRRQFAEALHVSLRDFARLRYP